MRVAVDSGPLNSGDAIRGIGVHTRELLSAFKQFENDNFQIEAIDFKKADLSKYDVIHYPYFNPHSLTLPFRKKAPKVVVTIHDLIRLVYPNAYPPGVRGRVNFFFQKLNLKKVDAIITISETSKKDIVRFLNIPAEKIFVTYLAPQSRSKNNNQKSEEKNGNLLPDKFVLYVGDVNYNKNLLNLAKACKLAKLKLVIVGKQSLIEDVDNNVENIPWKKFLDLYKNDKDIIRLGYVNDLDEVFKKATVYCQPSFYEGFGLPLLEAFERNLPVVASRTQALVEIGGDACLYVDPKDPEDIARGLKEIADNKKIAQGFIGKGKRQLLKYSWKRTAKETLSVYKILYSSIKETYF